ncbi:hypothetical protein WR25_03185, partial [Diploscapter pachys]
EEWRAGLVEGTKRSIYPVLYYIFSNVESLKERAYLAKFLVKVEVPSDVHDMDTAQLQNEVADLMEKFKAIHSQVVNVRSDMVLLNDIRQDLTAMEHEEEILGRKIERAQRKVHNLPQLQRYMALADELRRQKDRLSELNMQKGEQRNGVIHAEQKLQRLKAQLADVRAAGDNIDPSELIAQLQDEIATNNYLLNNKLSKEIELKRKTVRELSQVSDMPAIDNSDILKLQQQIDEKNALIQTMEQERDKSEEGFEENFSIFRHQAAAVERKKNAAAQRLQDARQELATIEAEVEAKKDDLRNKTGGEVLSAVQFRRYVDNLRARTSEYKKKRAEMEEIQTEKGVLMRTLELLNTRFQQLKDNIENLGGEVVDVIEVPTMERPKTAAPKSDNTDELRGMITDLMGEIDIKKESLEPLKGRKNVMQQEYNDLNEKVRLKKSDYDRRKEQIEQGYSNLKLEVTDLEDRLKKATEGYEDLERKLNDAEDQKRALNSGENLKEQLEKSLLEAQKESEQLSSSSNGVLDVEKARRQVKQWSSLLKMFQLKLDLVKDRMETGNSDHPLGDH